MTDDYQRRRVALHESGHTTMAVFLHRPTTLVSIRPGKHYAGIATWRSPRYSEADRSKLHLPVILQPARFRRAIETSICVALAGDIAEELVRDAHWEPTSGYTAEPEPTEDEKRAEQIARGLEALSERERERLRKLEEHPDPYLSDREDASERSWALDPDAPGRHLAWLTDVTRSIIHAPEIVRAIEALASELLEREVVGGRRARSIIQDAMRRRLRLEAVAASPKEGGE